MGSLEISVRHSRLCLRVQFSRKVIVSEIVSISSMSYYRLRNGWKKQHRKIMRIVSSNSSKSVRRSLLSRKRLQPSELQPTLSKEDWVIQSSNRLWSRKKI